MNILSRLLNLENKGVHQAKNEVTPELIRIQMRAKIAKEKAKDTVRHMEKLEGELQKLTAYKVGMAARRMRS